MEVEPRFPHLPLAMNRHGPVGCPKRGGKAGLQKYAHFFEKGLAPTRKVNTVRGSFMPPEVCNQTEEAARPVLCQKKLRKFSRECLTALFRIALVEGFPLGEKRSLKFTLCDRFDPKSN